MNLMDTVQRWKGAAMAQAAHLNQIPFICSSCDLNGQIRKQQEVTKNLKKAAIKHIVRLVLGILDRNVV